MKFRYLLATAAACCLLAFCGCADDKDSDKSNRSESESTSAVTTITSIVTVTDDEGSTITDSEGEAVTSVVTVTESEDNNDVTTVPFVTSVSETVITQKVTVTDAQGETVTDAKGSAQTQIVTTISEVIVTVKSTTTASKKSTTTAASSNSDDYTTTTTTLALTTTTSGVTPTTTTTSTTTAAGDITLKFSEIDYPSAGECFGTVSIPVTNTQMDLYMGDTDKILRKGIGLFYGSYLPGYEGKSIMCGHNSAGYLADLITYAKSNDMIGEQINISTTYGDYVYEIYETKILTNEDTTYFTTSYSTSTLILYSCLETTYTNQRIYFIAKKISGPVLTQ